MSPSSRRRTLSTVVVTASVVLLLATTQGTANAARRDVDWNQFFQWWETIFNWSFSAPTAPGATAPANPSQPTPANPSSPAATQPAAPPAAQPAPPGTSQTLFGTTVSRMNGESFDQSLARRDSKIAHLQILRLYNTGYPKAWKDEPGVKTGRALIVSFKVLPNEINSGGKDAFFTEWFKTAPTNQEIYWVYYHEPEDDIRDGKFTAADYRAAFARLDRLADSVNNPKLHTTQVLMEWTLEKSAHRNWRDYYPGKDVIDVQGWDTYGYDRDKKTYLTQDELQKIRPSYEITKAEGNQFAIAEIGGELRAGRPEWLRAVGAWAKEHQAAFVTYFDSTKDGNFILDDAPSQKAWGDVIRTHGAPSTGAYTR